MLNAKLWKESGINEMPALNCYNCLHYFFNLEETVSYKITTITTLTRSVILHALHDFLKNYKNARKCLTALLKLIRI